MTHIVVATPTYKNVVSTGYLQSLLQYVRTPRMPLFSYSMVPGDSLVTRARNSLFSRYAREYREHGYTHLFWQDDDIAIDGDGLVRVIESGHDVVGIPYPLKTDDLAWGIPCAVVGVYEEVRPFLYKALLTGTGALLMSNQAVEALVDYCESEEMFYMDKGAKIYDVFRVGARDGVYYSEDWHLCRVLRMLGFDIHVDSSSPCTHFEGGRAYTRPALEIDPRAIKRLDVSQLRPEEQLSYWTPNDYLSRHTDFPVSNFQ